MTKREYEDDQLRQRTINEVIRFLMRFADYSTTDIFRVPLNVQKALIAGVIPEVGSRVIVFMEKR